MGMMWLEHFDFYDFRLFLRGFFYFWAEIEWKLEIFGNFFDKISFDILKLSLKFIQTFNFFLKLPKLSKFHFILNFFFSLGSKESIKINRLMLLIPSNDSTDEAATTNKV